MFRLLLALGCLALSSGVILRGHKYCCLPDKLQGVEAVIGGYVARGRGTAFLVGGQFAFCRDSKRIAFMGNTTTPKTQVVVKVVQDFNSKTEYTILMEKQKCMKRKIRAPFNDGCVPDKAVMSGKFYFGVGDNKLEGEMYSMRHEKNNSLLDVHMSVSVSDCVPLSEAIVGSVRGVPIIETVGFVDLTMDITDPSLFDVPTFCKDNAHLDEEVPRPESSLRMFGF